MVNSYNSSTYASDNVLFLFESTLQDIKVEMLVGENFSIKSNNLSEVTLVHEAFKEKMKAAFDKLMANIAKLWGRFMEKVTAFFQSDEAYLKKYKNLILQKELKEETYTMFPYWDGAREMNAAKVPAFNFNSLFGQQNETPTEEDFISKHFKSFVKKDADFVEVAKTKFRGSDKNEKIAGSSISMNALYEFCIGYQDRAKALEKDMAEIEKAGNHAIKLLNQIKTESADMFGNKMYYSFVNESVIYEADDEKQATTPQKGSSEEDKKKADSSVDGENKKDQKKEDLNSSAETKNKDIDAVKMYIRVCYRFLSAKLAILEETYKAYMFIIRDHVKSYDGEKVTKDKEDDTKSGENNADQKKEDDQNKKDSGRGDGKNYSIMDRAKNAIKNRGNKKAANESGDIGEDMIIDPDEDPDSFDNKLLLEDE